MTDLQSLVVGLAMVCGLIGLGATPLGAADWTCRLPERLGSAVSAEIAPLKYGKTWAYAIELDDGPKWNRDFAQPFLATYRYTTAPPGVAGGESRPFVAGAAVLASGVGTNDNGLNWEDLAALRDAGWGVLNHSFAHSGRSWGDERGRLSDRQVQEDAFWSQQILAMGLGGRCPTAAVYANGYTDYNRNGALEAVGIAIATRVGGSGPARSDIPAAARMDRERNYLDHGAWVEHGGPLSGIPDAEGAGPAPGAFIIDFTHGIDQDPQSDNQQRWRQRLSHLSTQWGADGSDSLWCASTGEVNDYLRGAAAATVELDGGTLRVALPDELPGTALTIHLQGLDPDRRWRAPAGCLLYRQGSEAWLTTPIIGTPGAPAPEPSLRCIYDGPPADLTIPAGSKVAGVVLRCFGGGLPEGQLADIRLVGAAGERRLLGPDFAGGWLVGSALFPVLPCEEAVVCDRITIAEAEHIKGVRVYALP